MGDIRIRCCSRLGCPSPRPGVRRETTIYRAGKKIALLHVAHEISSSAAFPFAEGVAKKSVAERFTIVGDVWWRREGQRTPVLAQ